MMSRRLLNVAATGGLLPKLRAVDHMKSRGRETSRGAQRRLMGASGSRRSEKLRRPQHRAPHVRRRAAVEAEAFLGLPEVAADDIDEIVEVDLGVGVERVDVVDADQARRPVILV